MLGQLIDPVEGIDGDVVASLDNTEAAEKSASGDANVRMVFPAGVPVLKIPEIVCIKVFFPLPPLFTLPPTLALLVVVAVLLFPDITEDEDVEQFEYLEGELGIEVLLSFSSGLANEASLTFTLEEVDEKGESLVDTGIMSSFALLFLALLPLTLADEASLDARRTGIPNFAGSVSGVAGSKMEFDPLGGMPISAFIILPC